jgi:hypothetical protein
LGIPRNWRSPALPAHLSAITINSAKNLYT